MDERVINHLVRDTLNGPDPEIRRKGETPTSYVLTGRGDTIFDVCLRAFCIVYGLGLTPSTMDGESR